MVVVKMRDQNGIDTPQRRGIDLPSPAQVRNPTSQQGIGEEPDAAQVDENRCVPDVLNGGSGRGYNHIAILRRRTFGVRGEE